MKRAQRGAALLALLTVLVTSLAIFGAVTLRRMATRDSTVMAERRSIALAAESLRGYAFRQRCLNTALPNTNLLPCPDSGAVEGTAVGSCPGPSSGWLPWVSLGLPPLRDSSGTCLWYERQGVTARVIAAGGATAGQNRTSLPARTVCGGNHTATNYLDVADTAQSLTLDIPQILARCP